MEQLNQRVVFAYFCDDIRQEVGNKFSFVGCYQGVMVVQQFPAQLPKLCAHIIVLTPTGKPFERLVLRAKLNEDVVAELEFPVSNWVDNFNEKAASTELGRLSVQAMIVLSPLIVTEPSKLYTEAETEDGIISGSYLTIRAPLPEELPAASIAGKTN
ncbi:MAG: hypothetical protein Q8L02_02625 [Candidatus Nitrotoga sp.]|nr:hypothetical protein [Candidatus Nitrotoga sp.]